MRTNSILIGIFCMILLTGNVAADSTYGKMDVYYNHKLLAVKETPKPVLKIGEPFIVGINLTVYQKSDVYVSLSCMEQNSFEIINGPTSKIEKYTKVDILEANSSKEYEWTVRPTERWAGGALPLDIYYTILAHGDTEPLVNGGFTVAYPYISNEHYEGKVSTPEKQPVSNTEPSPAEPSPMSASTPAFSLAGAILILALVFIFLRR